MFVLWLTGLPGSGKTTLAYKIKEKLESRKLKTEILDGDWVRKTINQDAGFTKEERKQHLIRVAWISRLLARNGIITICSFVSPYEDVRKEVRRIIEEEVPFVEVYVKASLETVIKRDPKGLYKKALKGEIEHFTGISDPYEEPSNPDIIIDTDKETVEESSEKVISFLEEKKII